MTGPTHVCVFFTDWAPKNIYRGVYSVEQSLDSCFWIFVVNNNFCRPMNMTLGRQQTNEWNVLSVHKRKWCCLRTGTAWALFWFPLWPWTCTACLLLSWTGELGNTTYIKMAICQAPWSEFSPITSPGQWPLPSTMGEKRAGQSLPGPSDQHRSSPHSHRQMMWPAIGCFCGNLSQRLTGSKACWAQEQHAVPPFSCFSLAASSALLANHLKSLCASAACLHSEASMSYRTAATKLYRIESVLET